MGTPCPPRRRYWKAAFTVSWAGIVLGFGSGCSVLDAVIQPGQAAVVPAAVNETPSTVQSAAPVASPVPPTPAEPQGETLPIDLPTALRLTNVNNPTIALARLRLDKAYARLKQVQVLWLPDLIAGTNYQRHDGLLQTSRGEMVNVDKYTLYTAGGATLSWDTSEIYFGPLVARRLVDAQAAATRTVNNDTELAVALTYLDLLQAYAQLAINTDTLIRAEDLQKQSEAAARAELVRLTADPNRARAEVDQVRRERIDIEADVATISARLAQLLLLQPTVDLRPADTNVVPITLVTCDGSLEDLVAVGLMNRPELAESRALVAAALARWRQARILPLLPRINATYTAGNFDGDSNLFPGRNGGRGDGSVEVLWTARNLGIGNIAETRVRRLQADEASVHVTEIEARVAAEVVAAAKVARNRQRSLDAAQAAVEQALRAWEKMRVGAFGLNNPREKLVNTLDPLIAIQTLARARSDYLFEVIAYNKEQFRLYAALGQPPVTALPKAIPAPPVTVPAAPPPPTLPPLDTEKQP